MKALSCSEILYHKEEIQTTTLCIMLNTHKHYLCITCVVLYKVQTMTEIYIYISTPVLVTSCTQIHELFIYNAL